jgi:cytidylate kinase
MSNYSPALEKIAAKNIEKWLLAEHARERMQADSTPEVLGPVLTISREGGVPAHEIAQLVSTKLGWDVLDREIIECMAEEYGTTGDLVKAFDERHVGFMEGIFESWIEGLRFSGTNYFESLKRLFFVAANHGKVIILGRGAQFILPAASGFSVRLIAPLDARIEHVIKDRGLDKKQAKAEIQKTDNQRKEYIRSHFHKDLTDPHNFDLLINCARVTPEDASEIIATAVRTWQSD